MEFQLGPTPGGQDAMASTASGSGTTMLGILPSPTAVLAPQLLLPRVGSLQAEVRVHVRFTLGRYSAAFTFLDQDGSCHNVL